MEAGDEPVTVTYAVVTAGGRGWLVRRQAARDGGSDEPPWAEAVCPDVTGFSVSDAAAPAGATDGGSRAGGSRLGGRSGGRRRRGVVGREVDAAVTRRRGKRVENFRREWTGRQVRRAACGFAPYRARNTAKSRAANSGLRPSSAAPFARRANNDRRRLPNFADPRPPRLRAVDGADGPRDRRRRRWRACAGSSLERSPFARAGRRRTCSGAGAWSTCRSVLLPKAEAVLSAADPPAAEARRDLRLGGQTFTLVFGDEQAKANVNRLTAPAAWRRPSAACGKLAPTAAAAHRTAPLPDVPPGQRGPGDDADCRRRSSRSASFSSGARPAGPCGASRHRAPPVSAALTCWGDGSLNFRRASARGDPRGVRPSSRRPRSSRLLDLRAKDPEARTSSDALDQLKLTESGTGGAGRAARGRLVVSLPVDYHAALRSEAGMIWPCSDGRCAIASQSGQPSCSVGEYAGRGERT